MKNMMDDNLIVLDTDWTDTCFTAEDLMVISNKIEKEKCTTCAYCGNRFHVTPVFAEGISKPIIACCSKSCADQADHVAALWNHDYQDASLVSRYKKEDSKK
jgi:hypothetical protein